jgi:hypothetical protein
MKALKLVNKQVLNTVSRTEERRIVNKAQKSNNRNGMEGLVEAVRRQNYFCPKIRPNTWAIYKLE